MFFLTYNCVTLWCYYTVVCIFLCYNILKSRENRSYTYYNNIVRGSRIILKRRQKPQPSAMARKPAMAWRRIANVLCKVGILSGIIHGTKYYDVSGRCSVHAKHCNIREIRKSVYGITLPSSRHAVRHRI